MKFFTIRLPKTLKYLLVSIIFISVGYNILQQGIRAFILNLPTLFHVQFFFILGIWLWGINILTLERAKIDCTGLLTAAEAKPLRNTSVSYINHKNIFGLAWVYTIYFFSSLILYNYCSIYWEKTITEWIAVISIVSSFYFLFMPHRILYKRERKKFTDALIRIITPTLKIETSFSDVVMADLITSFSKVIGDFYVAFAELFITYLLTPYIDKKIGSNSVNAMNAVNDINIDIVTTDDIEIQRQNSIHFHHHIMLDAVGSFMILLPYLFRLRQCIADCFNKATKAQRKKSFMNALKYASSIPVYFFSGYYSWLKSDIKNLNNKNEIIDLVNQAEIIFLFWIVTQAINSAYSYYWDIFNDWDLCKKKKKNEESFPFLLRPILHFSRRWIYYAVMIIDLFLRFTWLIDVLPIFGLKHNFLIDDTPTVPEDIIKLQIERILLSRLALRLLEIVRRWLWIFFRLEREWVFTNSEYVRIENDERNYKSFDTLIDSVPILIH